MNQLLETDQLIKYYETLIKSHRGITYLEDAIATKDIDGWKLLTKKLGNSLLICANSLYSNDISMLNKKTSKVLLYILMRPNFFKFH